MITSTFSAIQEATDKQLGRSVDINAIAYPEHFKGNPYVTSIAHVALKVYPSIKHVLQVGPYLNCIRLGYGLNTPEALGYSAGDDLDDYNSLLLHFDCQEEYLEVSIMAVTEYADIRNDCSELMDSEELEIMLL